MQGEASYIDVRKCVEAINMPLCFGAFSVCDGDFRVLFDCVELKTRPLVCDFAIMPHDTGATIALIHKSRCGFELWTPK